jgi:fermentation-respiration switch protein FrsA (DUF1100 family)
MGIQKWYRTSMAMVLLLSSCSRALYYPSPQLIYDPARFGVKPDEVTFHSRNGAELSGWYFHNRLRKKPEATIVFFHGNAENISSHYLNLLWLLDYPFDFFIFDYQGYGSSEGDPSPEKTVQDGMAALEWAHAQAPERPLVVLGQSLGGAIGLRAAFEEKDKLPIQFIAVDSTFASYRSVARSVMSNHWITWPFQWIGWLVMSDKWAPTGYIEKLSPIPLLQIHGKKDPVVSFELGEALFAEAKEPKEFWAIENGHHTDIFNAQNSEYKQRFLRRMREALRDKK